MSQKPLPTTPLNISKGSPESFGWQRRPDLDTTSGLAYEKPSGDLMLFPRHGPKPALAKIKGLSLRDYPETKT
jgi:hypothetical protein